MLVMNFKFLIAHLCRKHHCSQHTLTRNLKHFGNQPSLDDSTCDFEHDDAINLSKCNFNLEISIL
jgi:hypothetical protein